MKKSAYTLETKNGDSRHVAALFKGILQANPEELESMVKQSARAENALRQVVKQYLASALLHNYKKLPETPSEKRTLDRIEGAVRQAFEGLFSKDLFRNVRAADKNAVFGRAVQRIYNELKERFSLLLATVDSPVDPEEASVSTQ